MLARFFRTPLEIGPKKEYNGICSDQKICFCPFTPKAGKQPETNLLSEDSPCQDSSVHILRSSNGPSV